MIKKVVGNMFNVYSYLISLVENDTLTLKQVSKFQNFSNVKETYLDDLIENNENLISEFRDLRRKQKGKSWKIGGNYKNFSETSYAVNKGVNSFIEALERTAEIDKKAEIYKNIFGESCIKDVYTLVIKTDIDTKTPDYE